MDQDLSRKLHSQRAQLTAADKADVSVRAGDIISARKFLRQAIRNEPANPIHRFRLGLVLKEIGNFDDAAEQASKALKLDAKHTGAARLLGEILGRGRLRNDVKLDPAGLLAALSHRTIDRDVIAAAALHHLLQSKSWQILIMEGKREGWSAAARALLEGKSRSLLHDPLWLAILEAGVIVEVNVEDLLTAARRHLLLEAKAERFSDPVMCRFVVALIRQMWLGEHVVEERADESLEVERTCRALTSQTASNVPVSAVFKALLYRTPEQIFTPDALDSLSSRLPAILMQALSERISITESVNSRSRNLKQYSKTSAPVSTAVASQYEASPYPRWTSIHVRRPGAYLEELAGLMGRPRLAFTSKPFEVLIAGCGTGRQAVSAAFDYGPNARILGIDIARKSVGYAAHMAEALGVTSIDWGVGDLMEIDQFEPSLKGRFQIVECTGVLHHTADLFGTWRKLIETLAPGGLMMIGLYSALARRNLGFLKDEPDFPGSAATDGELRAYRAKLRRRGKEDPSTEVIDRAGRDFYSASGFRDFFLHVNERHTTLAEIEAFLTATGLTFRGFAWPPIEALRTAFPDEPAPGRLATWSQFEATRPGVFAGMYQFWCSREG